jgi:hypothetical protein
MPFCLVVGMTAAAGPQPLAGLATGPTIYGGSAQLSAVRLLESGAGVAVIVASVLVINARLLLYGAAMAPHWSGAGPGFPTVSGDIDLNGILGLRDVRNGYQQVTVKFVVSGDAPEAVPREIVEQSRQRSAVFDVIANGVPVDIEVEVA